MGSRREPRPPSPPDPAKVIKAQSDANIQAANQSAIASSGTISGPGGQTQSNIRYVEDPNNPGKKIPIVDRTTTLDEAGQRGFDAASNLAASGASRATNLLNNQDTANQIEGRIVDLGSRRLNPLLEQQRRNAEARWAAQGLTRGSAAGDRAQMNLDQGQNDARNQLILSGWAQGQNALNADRSFALSAMGQGTAARNAISNPALPQQFNQQFNPVNAANIYQQNYNNRMAYHNARQHQRDQQFGWRDALSAGVGLGAAYLGAPA